MPSTGLKVVVYYIHNAMIYLGDNCSLENTSEGDVFFGRVEKRVLYGIKYEFLSRVRNEFLGNFETP